MTFKTILAHDALIDLEKIVSYYYKLNKSTAKKYYSNILKLIKELTIFPEIGRIVPEFEDVFSDKYRELVYENYRIIYRIENMIIKVIRILDGRMLHDINHLLEF